MPTTDVVITSPDGLHARPAAALAQAVAQSGVAVRLQRSGQEPAVDAASMLLVMGLGLTQGETVTLSTDAPDGEPMLNELAQLLESAR